MLEETIGHAYDIHKQSPLHLFSSASLKITIFDWIRSIHDCNVSYVKSLDQECVPFCDSFHLYSMYKSDEELKM